MLWLAVHLARLPIDCLALGVAAPDRASGACVVCDNSTGSGRVLAVNTAARQAGIVAGMQLRRAQLLDANLRILLRDPAAESRSLNQAALALLQFTPRLVLEEAAATLLLEVAASLRLFGGVRALQRRLLEQLAWLGLNGRLGIAPVAAAAGMLARQGGPGRRRFIRHAGMAMQLQRVPLELLPAAAAHAKWLEDLGCRSLGDLRRLPRKALARRCGTALLDAMDTLWGERPQAHDWFEAPQRFEARLEMPERVESAEFVMAGVRRLLAQLGGWLAARQYAVGHLRLVLHHERRPRIAASQSLELRLAAPEHDVRRLVILMRERLARLRMQAPVAALQLLVEDAQPTLAENASLFPEPARDADEFRHLQELLQARLGAQALSRPLPLPDHRPEVANHWEGHREAGGTMPVRRSVPLDADWRASGPRPVLLLVEPLALGVRGDRPFYASPLRLLGTAERIESGWWDGNAVARDYYVATSEDGARYWVFRQRCPDAEGKVRWYLHGLFA